MERGSPRIAFVVPRYGLDVLGGAEMLCRRLAGNLATHGVEVAVYTTCAVDHFTWRNELPAGSAVEDGVPVHRFEVSHRDHQRWLDIHTRIDLRHPVTYADEVEWMTHSAYSTDLQSALLEDAPDWTIPIPYLFGTTYWAAANNPHRTCLIPCLHDEPHAWTRVVRDMLRGVRGVFVNASGEGELLNRLAPETPRAVVGVGYEPAERPPDTTVAAFCTARGIKPGFLLYAGRREVAKGIPLLFDHYAELRRRWPDAPPLALMGSGDAEIPDEIVDHVIDLGFVADEDRDTVYAAASILVHPSVMESLGMVVLEAWLVGLPVIVNRSCAVLVDHCRESNGGLWFRNADEFCGAVTAILEDPDLGRQLAQNGAEYTLDHYSWTSVRQRLFTSLERWS